MKTTSSNVGKPGFIIGEIYDADTGHQVDWDQVPDSFKNANGNKSVPAGTIMSELSSGMMVPRSAGVQDSTAEDYPASFILATNANEKSETDSASGYGVLTGGRVFKNMLPESDATDFESWLTELNEAETTTGIGFQEYTDSRIS